jgi:hypothetical protein
LTKAAMRTAAALRGGADTGKSLFVALATGNLTVDGGGVNVVDDRLQTRVSRQVSGFVGLWWGGLSVSRAT